MKNDSAEGFTIIEVVIALAIAVVIYFILFRLVTLFLQTRGVHEVNQDIITTSDQILSRFNRSSNDATVFTVSGDGYQFSVTGKPCMLIQYIPLNKQIWYGEDSSQNCSPPATTSLLLNNQPVEVASLVFTPISTASAVKSVRLAFSLYSKRPFATRSASFTSAVTLWK
ncbi:prepilin-type N-terminal cleavage/methylation domain-containing protein [Candidatus Curtissbacteria bacterium]|nr:prepilin-type N-terminal cleavage/methylation domain-containing protein [Candidatus Curtissbacteria bacterium]